MSVSPNMTSATPRKAAATAAGPAPAKVQAPAADTKPVKYSFRQQERYDPRKLPQVPIPDFSVKDLLTAIPKHCYQRDALHSSVYVLQDIVLMTAAFYAATYIDPFVAGLDFSKSPIDSSWLSQQAQAKFLSLSLFAVYQIFQGLVFTGIWVNAHECGHQAFSSSKTINNSVGFVLHTWLLVPYHAWRISHARHHAATGHMTRDEVFVPRTREQRGLLPLRPAEPAENDDDFLAVPETEKKEAAASGEVEAPAYDDGDLTWSEWLDETLEDAPLYNLVMLLLQQVFGWQLYLTINASGQLHYPKNTNHFSPNSVIFDARHKWQIIASDIGIAVMIGGLVAASYLAPNGFWDVFRYYIVPYFWCNHWLVMITYLQHTDARLPHYTADEWTFPRGALSTIDREWLWPIGPFFFHGIAETHVAHHIHSKIPHYHAWEATRALKERLGPYYVHSSENVFRTLWKAARTCRFVDKDESVAFYRNAHGVPTAVPSKKRAEETSDSGVALSD